MACDASVFEDIPIFSLLDADERAVLAQHVELKRFSAGQRIYRSATPPAATSWCTQVDVVMLDADHQDS